ncbi:hypothetical protein TRFO_10552 [Tritrichomonas foetus]|uniref:Serine/threonine-protein phosphatase n=1 Tax=Tritrichomonas foetus TaxID=1144522 RepID=A0A1J4J8E6_9EUKA|nr:hypothetical protein TRFO_10552 [Tritrichomonas foetus]|eukprot:OHS95408.1 hypothetical protein TRFO_10552 [Tritrichomonas foetus]
MKKNLHNSIQMSVFTDTDSFFRLHLEALSGDLAQMASGAVKLHIPVPDATFVSNLAAETRAVFETEPPLLPLVGPIVVVGDLHGHLLDLYRIIKTFGLPPNRTYLFLGDLVDRGEFSIETICLVYAMKVLFPRNIYIIRGNHEFRSTSSMGGLMAEIEKLYGTAAIATCTTNSRFPGIHSSATFNQSLANPVISSNQISTSSPPSPLPLTGIAEVISNGQDIDNPNIPDTFNNQTNNSNRHNLLNNSNISQSYKEFSSKYNNNLGSNHRYGVTVASAVFDALVNSFQFMPLAATINNRILCLHGGLSPGFSEIDQITALERPIVNYENAVVCGLLWSDPTEKTDSFMPSPRGTGFLFGYKALFRFLKRNHLKMIIRGHECIKEGFVAKHENRILTVFSASNYCGVTGNQSAVVTVDPDLSVKVKYFYPFEYLKRKDAVYGSPRGQNLRRTVHMFVPQSQLKNPPIHRGSVTMTYTQARSIDRQITALSNTANATPIATTAPIELNNNSNTTTNPNSNSGNLNNHDQICDSNNNNNNSNKSINNNSVNSSMNDNNDMSNSTIGESDNIVIINNDCISNCSTAGMTGDAIVNGKGTVNYLRTSINCCNNNSNLNSCSGQQQKPIVQPSSTLNLKTSDLLKRITRRRVLQAPTGGEKTIVPGKQDA